MQGLIHSPGSIWDAFCKGAGATLLTVGTPLAGFILIHHDGDWQAAALVLALFVLSCALVAGGCCALGALLYKLSYDRLVRDGFPDEGGE